MDAMNETEQKASYGGSPDQLLGDLKQKVQESKRIRTQKERDWYVAREFYRGNQYSTWINGQGIVDALSVAQTPSARRKTRLINNLCRPSVEVILSYLLRNDPTMGVVPNTGEPEDQAAAMTARTVLYHYWQKLGLSKKLKTAGLYSFITGAGFWKVAWDPLGGPMVPQMQVVPMMPNPELPEVQQQMAAGVMPEPVMSMQQVGEIPGGDVKVDVVSPFELLPDTGAATLEECQWVIHHTMEPVSRMKALFPEHAEKLEPTQAPSNAEYEKMTLQHFGSTDRKSTRVEVFEYWHRKCPEYPQGLRVLFTNELILAQGPTPSGYAEIPFVMWAGKEVPGDFWPDSLLHDAIPMQKEHNKRFSQLASYANNFKPHWTAVIGSIDAEQLTDEDCQVIEHQPGMPPTQHVPPPVPDALIRLLEMTKESIEHTTGASGVLSGQMSGEVRSGRQVAYQGQYAEGRIGLEAKASADFIQAAGKMLLEMVQANVNEQRIARVVGKNRDVEVRAFIGSDIRGQTDVVCQPDTLLSLNKSERQNQLDKMLQLQVITPQEYRDMLDISDFSGVIEEVAMDRNQAQRENEKWRSNGMTEDPRPFEDHQVHIREHNRFRKSEVYRALDPQMQAAVDSHCQVHEQFVVGMNSPAPTGGEAPGGPPVPTDEQQYVNDAMKQSGQEMAEGLPPVPPVADLAPTGNADM